jgi:MFS family permease
VTGVGDLASSPLLRNRNYVLFLAGHSTSVLGNAMASVALAFAVLAGTGSLTYMGLVLSARILPLVVFLLAGGIIGDRFPRRLVMVSADCVRCGTQAALAVALLSGVADLWILLAISVLNGIGEAVFTPAYNSLMPSLVPAHKLVRANALLNAMNSTANVAGPALASVAVAFVAPAVVLLIDAASFLPSIVALLLIRVPDVKRKEQASVLDDLRHGWRTFTSWTWLWVITMQFTLFNLIVWAPYLVLGPASAARSYGGAGSWGIVLSLYGAGAVVGGLSLMGRSPTRPLLVATLATLTWIAPSAALAAQAPLPAVAGGAFLAGVSSAVFNTLFFTTVQRAVPADSLSRIMSYVAFGAYSVGPIGLAVAGPVAELTSISLVLWIGVAWQLFASTVIVSLRAVRGFRVDPSPHRDGRGPLRRLFRRNGVATAAVADVATEDHGGRVT